MSFRPIFHLEPRPHRELSAATSSRKQHIRFTYDILHICLQRGDLVGLALIPREREKERRRGKATREHVGYLKRVRLQIPEMQETLLKETVLALIDMEEYQEALDELDLYIVTMPFDQNAVLHIYAGMLWLYTAQPRRDTNEDEQEVVENDNELIRTQGYDLSRMASAKRHFRRALALDPENAFARGFLDRLGADVQEIQREPVTAMEVDEDEDLTVSDPVVLSDDEEARPIKKARSQSK